MSATAISPAPVKGRPPQFLRTRAVCELLGISSKTLRRWVKSGVFLVPPFQPTPKSPWLFPASQVYSALKAAGAGALAPCAS
jgi:predicted site-specific integrase-resolvase